MDSKGLAIVAVAGVAAAYMVARWSMDQAGSDGQPADATTTTDTTTADILDMVTSTVKSALGLWHAPAIADAESRYSIPTGMLERLLYQESHYRADVISGAKRSSVGALGIAQFMPATAADLGIDPLDPFQAIDGAGRYLASLYRMFGNWTQALAAYNWGAGNVQRKGLTNAPAETVAYYSSILADVNAASGTNYA